MKGERNDYEEPLEVLIPHQRVELQKRVAVKRQSIISPEGWIYGWKTEKIKIK